MTNQILATNTLSGPGIDPGSNSIGTLETIISSVIGILTVIAVIYFVIQIILTGYSMISSQGDPKQIEISKKRLTQNIIGLAIVILAYSLGALIASILGMSNILDLGTIFSQIGTTNSP